MNFAYQIILKFQEDSLENCQPAVTTTPIVPGRHMRPAKPQRADPGGGSDPLGD
jgi:hypothetical protein